MSRNTYLIPLLFLCLCVNILASEDILIADFEGDTYATGWKTEGTAFGTKPAKGTLPNQMQVTGFQGKGLVNSYYSSDQATGKLTSPGFNIQCKYISFLIGGGGHEGLSMNLLIDGKTVRTVRGPNVVPGGSERLEWCDWDVTEWKGKNAHIEIIDSIGGSWGHINVDQIIQTDKKHAAECRTVEFIPTKDFLHLPITMNAPKTWVHVEVDGIWQHEFECSLTVTGKPDFYANLHVAPWKGKKVAIIAEKVPSESEGLSLIVSSDMMSHEDTVYMETYRPQFHFSARTGWINDPNGLVHHDGVWHLFFQHNPYSREWGNMTWGHATSPDLLHWTEHPAAIYPDKLGTIYSGSGVVDGNNTSGFQSAPPVSPHPNSSSKGKKSHAPLVFFYTYSGPNARFGHPTTQGLAYSVDGGKTFTKYDKNPIIPHIIGGNRDPKVIWHEESKQWILALYMNREDYALFGSPNLKEWKMLSEIKNLGCSECPDFFPLAVDGDKDNTKWVFWGGNGKYLIGTFDGKEFKRESEPLTNKYGGSDYAAMTFSDAPDGRRIQLSWMNTWGDNSVYGGMPFNHQYTVPRELTLRTTPQGDVRLYMEPVKEVETLRGEGSGLKNVAIESGGEFLVKNEHDLFDMEAHFSFADTEKDGAGKLKLDIIGRIVEYDIAGKWITLDGIRAPLEIQNGKLKLRVLVDKTSIELFAQDGEVQIAKVFRPKSNVRYHAIAVESEGTPVVMEHIMIYEMESVWKRPNETAPPGSLQ